MDEMPGRRAEDLEMAEFQGEIRSFMKEIKEDLAAVKEQTTKTNGRVTRLETAAAVKAGIESAIGTRRDTAGKVVIAVASLLAAVLGSSCAVLLSYFLNH